MIIRIYDKQRTLKAEQEQDVKLAECAAKPYPYNVPNFQPFVSMSYYREVDTQNLYFDENGVLSIKT